MKFRWSDFLVAAGLPVLAVLFLNVMFPNCLGPYGPRYRSDAYERAVPRSFAGSVEDANAS
jgi:hypothetical protein